MEYIKKTLKNGVRVYVIPMRDSKTVTVSVYVNAGSEFENKKNNGISHFLEHMCFKGTPKRPSSILISKELDDIGAYFNAFTDREMTSYYAKSSNDKFDVILDVVADIYKNPLIDETEMNKERGVIVEEINMYEDMPMRDVDDVLVASMYGDQPAGWNIAGTKENVNAFTREDFLAYRANRYVAEKTVVVVAGNIDAAAAHEKVEKYFADVPRGKSPEKPTIREEQKAPAFVIKQKKTDQSHTVIGFRAFPLFDERRFALKVLSTVLGGGMSSRLFQVIREQLGAAYSVHTDMELCSDHGRFTIQTGSNHEKLPVVIEAALRECKKMKEIPLTDAELAAAKDQIIGNTAIGLETSDSWAGFYGAQAVLRDDVFSPDYLVEKIKAVTASEVQKLANELFQNDKMTVAIVSGSANEPELGKLLRV